MKILLDSNAYSAFMRGNYEVRDLIQAAEEVLLSAIVVGEQLFGFRQGAYYERNLAELRSFLERPYVSFVPVWSGNRGSLLQNSGILEGQRPSHPD